MSKEEEAKKKAAEEKKVVSRRQFVAGTVGGLVVGAAAGAAAGSLGFPQTVTVTETKEVTVEKRVPFEVPSPEVYDTGVLVIGGGSAGLTTAIEASDKGADVIIVDKGPLGHSGASGINWGTWFFSELGPPPKNPDELFGMMAVSMCEGVGDQKLLKSLADGVFEFKPALWAENEGMTAWRVPPDKVGFYDDISLIRHSLYPWLLREQIQRRGIRMFERTMITKLLTNGGQVVGAAGVDIKTGGFSVFRAKSTIVATGPYAQLYGWTGLSAFAMSMPEATGDGHALLYYAGAELVNMEFKSGEMQAFFPDALAASYGNICASPYSATYKDAVCNKDGEYFLKDFPFLTWPIAYTEVKKQVQAGKGGPHGGVFYDVNASWDKDTMIRMVLTRVKEKLGWDARAQLVEVAPAMYDAGGGGLMQVFVDEKRQTGVPGLYAVGIGATTAEGHCFGFQAAISAAERAASIERPEIDLEQLDKERTRVYNILGATPENPVRPHVIRHRLQNLAPKYVGLNRSDEGLKECIAEIDRIRKEDLPRMGVASKTGTWNREFLEALEMEPMIDALEMIARSALMRTETRLCHYRDDYPNRDDKNWLANVYVKQVDGNMVLEKRPIVWTIIPPEALAGMLGP